MAHPGLSLFDESVVFKAQVKTFSVARQILSNELECVRVLPPYRDEATLQVRHKIAKAVIAIRQGDGKFPVKPKCGLTTIYLGHCRP